MMNAHHMIRPKQYLNGKLCLLSPESGPQIDLHLVRHGLPQQPCQEGVTGCPPQVLAQLTEQPGHVMMDAHNLLLTSGLLLEG